MSSEMKLSDWKKLYTLIIEDDSAIISKYKGAETEVTVPSCVGQYRVIKIGKKAFSKKLVTKVILPETIAEIGENAFEECTALTEVNIPDTVEKIGEYAFSWSGVKKITLPSRITKIESGVFDICRKLEQVVFPEGVLEIGSSAFGGCSGLKELNLPENLEIIGDYAFSGCTALEITEIPANVKQIGEFAFSDCGTLGKKIILNGKPKIGKLAFSFSYDRVDSLFLNHLRGLEVQAPKDVAVFPFLMAWDKAHPSMICGILRRLLRREYPTRDADLLWLAKKVMTGNKTLLPEFCKAITPEELAFMSDHKLITAKNADILLELLKKDIPLKTQQLACISENADKTGRNKAEEKKLNAAVSRAQKQYKALEKAVQDFSQKKPVQVAQEWRIDKREDGLWLTEYLGEDVVIVIPGFIGNERVAGIAEDAMRAACPENDDKKSEYNKKMGKTKAVIISEGIETLEENVFAGCIYMTNAVLPQSLRNIAPNAFANCHKLTVLALAGSAAEDFANRTDIPFAEDDSMTKTVGEICLKNSLTAVEIPTETKARTFAQWREVFKFTTTDGCITITGYKSKDPVVEVPTVIGKNKVTEIGFGAFRDSNTVRRIVVPEGVMEVSGYAFENCKKLQSVTLPSTLQEIDWNTFARCPELKEVHISGNTNRIDPNAISSCPKLTIYAPAGSYAETYAREHDIPFVAE